MSLLRATPLLSLLALLACGSGDSRPAATIDDPNAEAVPTAHGVASPGSFEVTLTGDVNDRFSGVSGFFTATDEDTGETGFVLVMNENPDTSEARTLMIGGSGERPAIGEYPFMNVETLDEGAENPPPGHYSAQIYSPGDYMLHPAGGTLRITESTHTRLAGTLSFSALGVRFTAGQPHSPTGVVNVEGRFEAILVEIDD